jgi:catechol 2,3-dioxygenase-like lactoylglutathione lyase family enzyme
VELLASRVLFRPADYQKSVVFYRDAIGLAIAREYGAGTVFYAGQSLIELAGHGGQERSDPGNTHGGQERSEAPPFPGALWLQVRDVYATQAELESRDVPIAREATQEPWGLHEMHVTDPDGVTLIFVQVPDTHPLRRDTRD